MTFAETRWMTALDYYRRRREIYSMYYYKEDFTLLKRSFKDVNFRIYIEPAESLTGDGIVPINGTVEDLRKEVVQGYQDGNIAIEAYKDKVYEDSKRDPS